MAYICVMVKRSNTVVEMDQFKARAKGRMTAAEIVAVVNLLAADPLCGDLIQGTGGVRKVRIAAKGKGKSGGVRVVYYYHNETLPVYLVTVFAIFCFQELPKAERNTLAKLVKALRGD